MAKREHQKLDTTYSNFFSDIDAGHSERAPHRNRIQVKLILKSESDIDALDIPRHLSIKQRHKLFAKAIGVQEDHLRQIKSFAQKYGLRIDKFNDALGIATLSGTILAMNKAFKVDLHHHAVKHEKTEEILQVLGHKGKAAVPMEIHAIVEGIIGLNRNPASHQAPSGTAETIGVCASMGRTSAWFADYYKFPKEFDGSGQHIAIISCGGGFNGKDFEAYFSKAGIKNPPKIKFKSLDGSPNTAGQNRLADYELYTDCLVAACAAPGASITVCSVENSVFGFAEGVQYLASLGARAPQAISYSWGASETSYTKADIIGVNRKLQYATLVSQISIFCATGDFGSTNESGQNLMPSRKQTNKLTVQYPASSPWVTSCGGTMFRLSGTGKVQKEVAWNSVYLYDMLVQNASGGGFSEMQKRPAYQKSAIRNNEYPGKYKGKRGLPDVAAHANVAPDNICYWVFMQGQNWVTGGTSAVAPLWAALTVRLTQAMKERIGFFNPLLYEMASSRALRSITEGNNNMPNAPELWQASPGWDPCTGLGVPNGKEILKWLKKKL